MSFFFLFVSCLYISMRTPSAVLQYRQNHRLMWPIYIFLRLLNIAHLSSSYPGVIVVLFGLHVAVFYKVKLASIVSNAAFLSISVSMM